MRQNAIFIQMSGFYAVFSYLCTTEKSIMSTLTDIQSHISSDLSQLNGLIARTLESPNPLMNRVIDNYLKTKGKQIRPILVILSARLLGNVTPNVIFAAASVELLHNASLIHDDVVDETKMRRNAPTINGLWDNHIAVLVGDFFVSTSLQCALKTSDLRVIDSVAKLGRMLSIGEIDQIYNARYHHLDEDAYFRTIERKTASLFMSCAEMGAYTCGSPADEARIATLRQFTRLLGLCFQIKDDIFDYFGNEGIGKPTGNDLREGKITLPLLYALLNGPENERVAMTELSRKEVLEPCEIERLIDYAKRCGGIEYAYGRMEDMRKEAVDSLVAAFPDNEVTGMLVDLFDYTIARRF